MGRKFTHDGVTYERLDDGGVRIEKLGAGKVLFRTTLGPDEWDELAAVIAGDPIRRDPPQATEVTKPTDPTLRDQGRERMDGETSTREKDAEELPEGQEGDENPPPGEEGHEPTDPAMKPAEGDEGEPAGDAPATDPVTQTQVA